MFGNIPDMDAAFPRICGMTDGVVEIMCHPVWNDGGQLVDAEFGKPLVELLSPFVKSSAVRMCSYFGL